MQNMQDFIETNGASLTIDVKDLCLTGENAKQCIEEMIKKNGLTKIKVILSHGMSLPRITARVTGDLKNIKGLEEDILQTEKFSVIGNKSLKL